MTNILSRAIVETGPYVRYDDFNKDSPLLSVTVDEGPTNPTVYNKQQQYILRVALGVEFWCVPSLKTRMTHDAKRRLLYLIYGEQNNILDTVIYAIQNGNRDKALKACLKLKDSMVKLDD